MRVLNCDICRKKLEDPIVGRTYWNFQEYDVCEDCKDSIEAKLRPILRQHVPYTFDWYNKQFMASIEKGVALKRV